MERRDREKYYAEPEGGMDYTSYVNTPHVKDGWPKWMKSTVSDDCWARVGAHGEIGITGFMVEDTPFQFDFECRCKLIQLHDDLLDAKEIGLANIKAMLEGMIRDIEKLQADVEKERTIPSED